MYLKIHIGNICIKKDGENGFFIVLKYYLSFYGLVILRATPEEPNALSF